MNGKQYYADKLVTARQLRGLTQQTVADALEVDVMTIKRAEAGIVVSYDTLAKICGHYKIPMTQIVVPEPVLAAA